jgi:hypothetical protein
MQLSEVELANLAQTYFDNAVTGQLDLSKLFPDLVFARERPALPAAGGARHYNVQCQFSGMVGGRLDVNFYKNNQNVGLCTGFIFGLMMTAGITAGQATFNYDVEWICQQKWQARVLLVVMPTTIAAYFWEMRGPLIGSLVCGGLSTGAGICGGVLDFK